jgi:putative membrane protein
MTQAHILSADDRLKVSEAVRAAETGTSGEIVTIVADHSDRYLDAALWWSVAAGVLGLSVLAAFPGFSQKLLGIVTGGWVSELSLAEAFELALAVFTLKFAAVRLLMQWIPLRLALTLGGVKGRRVRRRAIRYFKVGAERRTAGRTGILIYLSLAERRAEIVADEAIHAVVPEAVWGDAMADMLALVRQGKVADGMAAAVRDVGVILAAQFPRAADDANELPDRLIEL